MQKTITLSAALAALMILAGSAMAQTPPPPPPVHHGIFGKMFHPKPKLVQPATGSFGRPGHMMPGHPGMMGQPGMMGHPGMVGQPGMMGHPGMMGRPGMGGMMPMHGGVVGNKNSRVYHLPGDRGAMPAVQNRIYFPTAAAAEAAGYRRAGGARSTMGRPMMHGSPTHGMPGMTR